MQAGGGFCASRRRRTRYWRDCSSDVCSSDLPAEDVRATGGGARSALWRGLQADAYDTPIRRTVADEGPAYAAAPLEIGRAACRERVQISGVAASLKQKTRDLGTLLLPIQHQT